MKAIADWFIYGEVDWDLYNAKLQEWGPLVAGALFGIGWWCWADALVQVSTGESGAYPFRYNWPGIVATLALLLINALPRKDLAEAAESIEDGVELRARLWLLFSFLTAFAAVGGSVAVLIQCTQQSQFVSVGVGSVLQCGFILASALLLWAYRSDDGGGYYTGF
ncbi:hypothetical protein ACKKBG_A08560 [Auxenochlorella protothecoides x Auxenochlorella symbiontica]